MVTEPRLLGERYSLGGVLGYGGMAEVHRAMDTRLSREVAIKTLRADLARDPSFQARFRREAQSAASLNHPSIVAVYDTGEEDRGTERVPFIVMEYVEGRTLRDVLNTERRLPWRQALEISAKICPALDYSHRQGIVHRDIKPANVMLTADNSVKVMDFGIARAVTASSATMTQTAAVMGTAQYLSPEQARGEPVDARSDVYSTGCLLYELVTGTPPFTGDSPVAVAYQHVREDPVPPSQVIPGLPPAVDAIILKAMAKNPANRYQSAAEMGRDCERALAGTPVVATPLMDAQTVAIGSAPVAESTTVLLRDPPSSEPRRRGLGYLLLAVACLAVLIGAALLTRSLVAGKRVSVPDLKGGSVANAQAALTRKGLKLGDQRLQQSASKAGIVIDQDPAANKDVKKGGTVDIVVSAGPSTVTLPDLTGSSLEGATATLKDRQLALGVTTPKASRAPAGTVLGQSPRPGQVRPGTKVNLTVASGKGTVPVVLGLTRAQAQAALNSAGFGMNSVPVVTGAHTADRVYRQNPPAGRALDIGSQVTVTIAVEPASSPTPSVTPTTPTPSASATPSTPTPSETPTTPVTPPSTGVPTGTSSSPVAP
ncbi:MAG: Stk1 family PASTA domain-containing Ser/Thr kinase [Frankiaceae bacterium]